MKLLLLCLLAACCHAQNSGESLLLRIEEHQNKLRNWEEDNSRLLTTLTEKRKKYDNAIHNEKKLLEIVDYLVKKNMEVLQNVVSELNKVQFNIKGEVDGNKTLHDKDLKTIDKEQTKELENVETMGDKETRSLVRELAAEDSTEANKEVENMERDVDGDETLHDKETSIFISDLLNGIDTKGDDVEQNRSDDDEESPENNEDIGIEYDEPHFWYNP